MARRRRKVAGRSEAIAAVLIALFLPSILAVVVFVAVVWQLMTGGL